MKTRIYCLCSMPYYSSKLQANIDILFLKHKCGYYFLTFETLVATSADSVPSSYLVRITIAPIGTTFGNLQ